MDETWDLELNTAVIVTGLGQVIPRLSVIVQSADRADRADRAERAKRAKKKKGQVRVVSGSLLRRCVGTHKQPMDLR